MRLVIDFQGAQSASRERGIGRYTTSLAREMIRQKGKHEVFLVLNGLLVDTIEPVCAAFADILPQDHILVWEAAGPVRFMEDGNAQRRMAAEILRESFIASLNPDMILITSLFEGMLDDAVTSIGSIYSDYPSAVIFYDLIPLLYSERYLGNDQITRWYLSKLKHFQKADLLLAISESTAQEAVDNLMFSEDVVVNISTACDNSFRPLVVDTETRGKIAKKFGINRDFILYTTAGDARKNNDALVRAFGSLPTAVRKRHQLVFISSSLPADQETALRKIASSSGVSPNDFLILRLVSDDDLALLYSACKLFVFPSLHEGFGLPALEAMACGAVAIGSNRSSLPEVLGDEELLFDPLDDQSISDRILEFVTDEAKLERFRSHARKQAGKFSWSDCAARSWSALEKFLADTAR